MESEEGAVGQSTGSNLYSWLPAGIGGDCWNIPCVAGGSEAQVTAGACAWSLRPGGKQSCRTELLTWGLWVEQKVVPPAGAGTLPPTLNLVSGHPKEDLSAFHHFHCYRPIIQATTCNSLLAGHPVFFRLSLCWLNFHNSMSDGP